MNTSSNYHVCQEIQSRYQRSLSSLFLDSHYGIPMFRTTFSIWATELDSCSPYSNSNSSTISNQPRFNELEMRSILFELDSTISCSIKRTSLVYLVFYRARFFLSVSYWARFGIELGLIFIQQMRGNLVPRLGREHGTSESGHVSGKFVEFSSWIRDFLGVCFRSNSKKKKKSDRRRAKNDLYC